MPRFQNPFPQYLDDNGDPSADAKLYFYKSGTNTKKTIYADSQELIPIDNPVEIRADGSVPDIFYSGSARVRLLDKEGEQIFDRDPVGGESQLGNFSEFDLVVIYEQNDIVVAANNRFYKSLNNSNQGNDPTLNPGANENWEEVRFLSIYNTTISYDAGVVVQTSDGYTWRSMLNANLNNDPSTDDGTNWRPVVDIVRVPEYAEVIPLTGGGNLTAARLNEMRDGGTYSLPAANSVTANTWIEFSLPERYKDLEPAVQAIGADTITSSTGTDTSITYNAESFGSIRLTSDGSSNWSI